MKADIFITYKTLFTPKPWPEMHCQYHIVLQNTKLISSIPKPYRLGIDNYGRYEDLGILH